MEDHISHMYDNIHTWTQKTTGGLNDRLREKTEDMKKHAVSFCQRALSFCFTEKQITTTKSEMLCLSRETP